MDQYLNLTALKLRYALVGFLVAVILGGIAILYLQAQGRRTFETVAYGATCTDGVDNDGNGLVDSMDPGCQSGGTGE